MKIDLKKAKSFAITYGTIAVPFATAAFATNQSLTVKILSILSGTIGVVVRDRNPKDPFTANILSVAKTEIDATIAKKSASK